MDQHYMLSESAVPNSFETPYAVYPNQSRPELDHRCQPFFVIQESFENILNF